MNGRKEIQKNKKTMIESEIRESMFLSDAGKLVISGVTGD